MTRDNRMTTLSAAHDLFCTSQYLDRNNFLVHNYSVAEILPSDIE